MYIYIICVLVVVRFLDVDKGARVLIHPHQYQFCVLYQLYHATAPTQRFQSDRLHRCSDVFQLYHVAVAALRHTTDLY